MNRFVLFLKKIYVPLLFIILEVVAINYYADSTSYTRAKILTVSNNAVGWIHKGMSGVGNYFALRRENRELLDELTILRNEFEQYRSDHPTTEQIPQMEGELARYVFTSASVINNTLSRQENYIMLDKGERDGIRTNMALTTVGGAVVGYVVNCSDRFSVGISILNTKFRTPGKIKGKGNPGAVSWDGRDHTRAMFTELDKYAEIAVGDTIVTGNSLFFPSDLTIGTVESFELAPTGTYDVRIKLAADLSTVQRLVVIGYSDLHERGTLEEEYFDAEINIE